MTLRRAYKIRRNSQSLRTKKSPSWEAFVGDGNGVIEVPGHPDDWYVRPIGSDMPVIVRRGAAAKLEGLRVRIGREFSDGTGRLRILGVTASGGATSSGVDAHGSSHLAGASDPIYIDTVQIINGLAYATSGMLVTINAGWAIIDGQPVKWSLSALDLTSDIPASGALYGLIRVDADGLIDVQVGDAVASFADLTWGDTPKIADGYAALAVVRLYDGQSSLSRLYANPDVIDIRFAPSSEAGRTAEMLYLVEHFLDIELTRHLLGL